MKKIMLPLAISIAFIAGANATIAAPAGGEETKAFLGLNWSFGSGNVGGPEAVLGVSNCVFDGLGSVSGAKASAHVGFQDKLGLSKLKLTGLTGDTTMQAEIGLGYNFGSNSVFGVGGANFEYMAVGVDIYGSGGIQGYGGLHSIGQCGPEFVF